MNILIISRKPLGIPSHVETPDYDIFFRSRPSGLKTLPADYAICLPGCTPEQIALATERTRPVGGEIMILNAAIGYEPGDVCNRNGCKGIIEEHEVENCSCHISPPCSQCTEDRTYCSECDYRGKDEA
jgi:hypothetical protein